MHSRNRSPPWCKWLQGLRGWVRNTTTKMMPMVLYPSALARESTPHFHQPSDEYGTFTGAGISDSTPKVQIACLKPQVQ